LYNTEVPMKKSLSAIGNSLGIVIEKPILELLNITRETELEMTTDGHRLIIEPIRPTHREKVLAATERVMNRHDETLRKLAE
jgi:antitoxin MazE